jgi:hypothetical protein
MCAVKRDIEPETKQAYEWGAFFAEMDFSDCLLYSSQTFIEALFR